MHTLVKGGTAHTEFVLGEQVIDRDVLCPIAVVQDADADGRRRSLTLWGTRWSGSACLLDRLSSRIVVEYRPRLRETHQEKEKTSVVMGMDDIPRR